MRISCLLAFVVVSSAACLRGPVLSTGAPPPSVGGTIAGVVTTTDSKVAVPSRMVTATETTTGSRHETTTASNGGYTIQVPEGTYRVEVELRAGETLAQQPDPTQVNNSDLDAGRDFVITLDPS